MYERAIDPYAGVMVGEQVEEQAALVALLRHRSDGAKWPEIVADVVEAGSAVEVWRGRHSGVLLPDPDDEDAFDAARRDIDAWVGRGLRFFTILDEDYPARLKGIHEAPPFLFGRGSLVSDDLAVSVVGSREASERGLGIASAVAGELVSKGITVVAGLALGIDTAAHVAALEAGGRTVAVIGTGINKVYPAQNRALHGQIATRGLLLSQFWPDAPPQKFTFLMRNATMSGYGRATVVVEAGETSGARAQARMAVGHGRPVILTDLVVDRNEWARALVGRPGVFVASSVKEVIDTVCGLLHQGDEVVSALSRFALA